MKERWDVFLTMVDPSGQHFIVKYSGQGETAAEGVKDVFSYLRLQDDWTLYEVQAYPEEERYYFPPGTFKRTPQWEVTGDPQNTKPEEEFDPPIPGEEPRSLITEAPVTFPS